MSKVLCLLAFNSSRYAHHKKVGESGDVYLDNAKKLIQKAKLSGINIMLMTDTPSYFEGLQIEIVRPPVVDSYCNKFRICKLALEKYETAVYVDVDCMLDFNVLNEVEFSEGFHYRDPWTTGDKILNFSDITSHPRGLAYFSAVQNYCNEHDLEIENVPLIAERIFVIKGKNPEFFQMLEELSKIAETNDVKFGNLPVGSAEGLLIGIALANTNIKNNGATQEIKNISKNLYNIMKAIHVNWTAPFFHRERLRGHGFSITKNIKSGTYELPNYQILYTVLSALNWKLNNGPIKLYTDSVGLSYYKQLGICDLYDEIDTEFLDNLQNVDPAYYWTSGKIQALQNETEPFVFLDQDFIVRNRVPESFYSSDLGIGHWEIPRGEYYFTKKQWESEIKHIEFPENYNCNAYSPNTSFLYFKNPEVVSKYVELHKKLIDSGDHQVPEWFWLATDQGILGHVIRENKFTTNTLTDRVFLSDSDYAQLKDKPFGYSEQWYYPINHDKTKDQFEWEHVWLAKVVFGYDTEFMEQECQRYYDEIWSLGGSNYLYYFNLNKYWDKERHGYK